jgi:hypothetical protein
MFSVSKEIIFHCHLHTLKASLGWHTPSSARTCWPHYAASKNRINVSDEMEGHEDKRNQH